MKQSSGQKGGSRVFLIEADPTVRRLLARLVDAEADLSACGGSESVDEALVEVPEAHPDVIVVNVDQLTGPIVPSLNRLRWASPGIPIVAISIWEGTLRGRRMLQAGVAGYVPKSEAAIHIIPALRRVLKGGIYAGRWAGKKR